MTKPSKAPSDGPISRSGKPSYQRDSKNTSECRTPESCGSDWKCSGAWRCTLLSPLKRNNFPPPRGRSNDCMYRSRVWTCWRYDFAPFVFLRGVPKGVIIRCYQMDYTWSEVREKLTARPSSMENSSLMHHRWFSTGCVVGVAFARLLRLSMSSSLLPSLSTPSKQSLCIS